MNTLFYLAVTRAIYRSHDKHPAHREERKGDTVSELQKWLKAREKLGNTDICMKKFMSVQVTPIYFSAPSILRQSSLKYQRND